MGWERNKAEKNVSKMTGVTTRKYSTSCLGAKDWLTFFGNMIPKIDFFLVLL